MWRMERQGQLWSRFTFLMQLGLTYLSTGFSKQTGGSLSDDSALRIRLHSATETQIPGLASQFYGH